MSENKVTGMTEKKYELHVWFYEWYPDDPQELAISGQWACRKVVLRFHSNSWRNKQIGDILRNEWWREDRLIPFREVLRMERREATDGTTS